MAEKKVVEGSVFKDVASLVHLLEKWAIDWKLTPKEILNTWQQQSRFAVTGLIKGTHKIMEIGLPLEPSSDNFVMWINRAVKPRIENTSLSYFLYEDLQKTGPAKYDLRDLKIIPQEKETSAYDYYNLLKNEETISSCIRLIDLLHLQTKDPKIFNNLFRGKKVLAWGSAGKLINETLAVPYVCCKREDLEVDWFDFYYSTGGGEWKEVDFYGHELTVSFV